MLYNIRIGLLDRFHKVMTMLLTHFIVTVFTPRKLLSGYLIFKVCINIILIITGIIFSL